ncbi:MAG: B12-binding domain-containing radical SAM protein [Planctomycetota bacterium]
MTDVAAAPITKKKIVLMYVTPPGQDDFFIAMPLGIIYLASILRQQGADVECCDERVCAEAEVEAYLRKAQILGLSALTPHVNRAIRYAQRAKANNPQVVTVMGGPHATVDVDTFLDSGAIDYVIGGEAEDSIVDFMRGVDLGRTALAAVPGIAFQRADGTRHQNPQPALIKDLDRIPFPAWEQLPFERYAAMNKEKLFYIFTSRGCPFRCVFCQKELTGRGFRTRTVKNILDELQLIHDRYNPGNVLFIDELFTCQKKRVYEICEGIVERGLKLNMSCETRVDMLDYDMARTMKRAGFNRMYFGVESGSQRSLDTLVKDYKVEKVVEALKITRRAGIWTKVFLIVGTPGETLQDIAETAAVLREGLPDRVRTSLFNPLTATASFEQFKGRIDPDLVRTEYVDSDRSPYIHENFNNDELNRIKRELVEQYEAFYESRPARTRRFLARLRYYWENKDEGKARLARAFSFGRVKAPAPVSDAGVEI